MGFEQRLNDCIGWLVRHGVPLMGASWLEVRGRRSGQPHGLPVNPIAVDGARYLVAPRGDTHWVRNLRAAGECTLGGDRYAASEVPVALRTPILLAYYRRWGWQVKQWMSADPDPAAHPVFRIVAREGAEASARR